ncbi:hypothetical protein MCUN1_000071 [Malassezia cuniculi]|uniref:Meiotically up-regulated gene 190 protein n=1 Tax=Malassezia cuniculi TaxID=948313 RepID=A0AAF0EMC0_9BASI|nr:hypothetical protein MCUN1_000071 [Malassezia cuniculi]
MPSQYYGQGWSDRNPVPTIQGYEAEVHKLQQEYGSDKPDRSDAASTVSRFVGMLRHTDEVAMDKLNTNTVIDPDNNIVEAAERTSIIGVHSTPNAVGGAAELLSPRRAAATSSAVATGTSAGRRRSNVTNKTSTATNSKMSVNPKSAKPPSDITTVAPADEPDKADLDTDDEEDLEDAHKGDKEEFTGGENEKDRIKKAATTTEKVPAHFHHKGDRFVNDPVTHRPVLIRDGKDTGRVDPKMLDSRYPQGFSHTPMIDPELLRNKYTSPDPAQPTSILLQRFPAPVETKAMSKLSASFDRLTTALMSAIALIWLSIAFGSGWFTFFYRTVMIGTGAVVAWCSIAISFRRIEKEFEDVRAHMHRQRGKRFSPPTPESVEWLNAAVACIWKQTNPEMFVSMIDMVEDIMQSSLPAFVDAVKISDFGLGENPLRFIAMRGLADLMTDPEYPRRTWIERGEDPPNEVSEEVDKSEKDDNAGDFLNMEVSFCYSAIPGETSDKRAQNIHLLIEFFIGAFDLFEIPLPIWIQVERVIGTVRLRAQIVSEAPYLRNLTFSFMGVPKVSISAIPMLRFMPNVLDLPLISGFVHSAIATAANMYVAPRSMTLNMSQMLSGDGIKKDTDSLGVLVVRISAGVDLSSQDMNGKSDPYCVLSYTKFGRPLYATRIIFEDLNPVWEETAFLLITRDDIRSDESLSLQLWDSDRHTADDIVGRVTIPLKQFARKANEMQSYESELLGFEDNDKMQGRLKWSAGFFEKSKFNQALRKEHHGESEAEQQSEIHATSVDSTEGAESLVTPPDPERPSGILSVIIKHIAGLENREVEKGVKGIEREGASGQDVSATSTKLPSSYCELILNDTLFFKTRVKQYTNMPFFNAGTEVFVRDWTMSKVDIVVRDARLREHDPIMGIVSLPLKSLFTESSMVEQSFGIQDGVGYGKVLVNFVFRSVKLSLPRELRGWDKVVLEIVSNITIAGASDEWSKKLNNSKITISIGEFSAKLPSLRKQDPVDTEGEPLLRLPVQDRYKNNIIFEFGRSPIPTVNGTIALANLPLNELIDAEMMDVSLPIVTGPQMFALRRNRINAQTKETHEFEQVGTMEMRLFVHPGIGEEHRPMTIGAKDRHEFEVYERLVGLPKRSEENSHAMDDGVITAQERRAISKAKMQGLHVRHRGIMGYAPVRTAVWAKDGLRDHLRNLGDHISGKIRRDQTVLSEV